MSHLESGFCVTDVESLAKTVKERCPDLEMVKAVDGKYRTWATDHGKLVGDYPLPGIYQIKLVAALKKQGVDVHAKAKEQGVTLPENLLDLEKKPWSLDEQRKLLKDATFKKSYDVLNEKVISQDAEYVIRYKEGKGNKSAYEIGLIRHPVRKGEFVMMTDFYHQGEGLLNAKGVGKHVHNKDGSDTWGGELKQAYAIRAAEKTIQEQIQAGNPEFGSYTKTVLPDGRVKIEVQPRNS